MENFLLEIKKFVLSKILKRHYYRTGRCKACGKCCTKIYVKHFKHVIQDEEEFKKLQYLHRFYTYLKVIDKDETGLVFECQNLDKETHKCKIHKSRPGICRRYPQEELFSMGGALSDDCGYKMLPIIPFSKVMQKLSKKKLILPFIFVLFALPVSADNGFSEDFIKNFKTCSLYAEEISFNKNGNVINDMKFITKNDRNSCFYHQIVMSSLGTVSVKCKFSAIQQSELYKAMLINPSNSYDKSAENLWNKYINSPEVCSVDVKNNLIGQPIVPDEYLPWK